MQLILPISIKGPPPRDPDRPHAYTRRKVTSSRLTAPPGGSWGDDLPCNVCGGSRNLVVHGKTMKFPSVWHDDLLSSLPPLAM